MIQNPQRNHLLEIFILPVNNTLNRFYLFWATGFFTGFIPKAPGTIGTIVGTLLFLISNTINIKLQIVILTFYLIISIKSTRFAITYFNKKDPSQVNCDEIIGIWVALLFFPPTIPIIIIAFTLFRIFDIFKPFPVKNLERLPGPFGIIADDLLAGLLTKGVIWLSMKIF
jgi:phosphatidylglycerophosphatase A